MLERTLGSEFLRVTETAALAAARWIGQGDNHAADNAAVEAMRHALEDVEIDGTIVIGEGERDEAPMLFIGEQVGTGRGPKIDIAVDPVEGTNLVARGSQGSIAVMAASERGGLLHAPDTYMRKLVVGHAAGDRVSLDFSVAENLRIIADSLNRKIETISVVVLDRPRHETLIKEIREAGARVRLIPDGDLSAGISAAIDGTGVHAVMGTGGAPEGVLSAAALRCLGGTILGQITPRNAGEAERARSMGIDLQRTYRTEDLASGENIIFAATGITEGDLLHGIHQFNGGARTHTLLITYQTGVLRFVDSIQIQERNALDVIRF